MYMMVFTWAVSIWITINFNITADTMNGLIDNRVFTMKGGDDL